MSMWKIPVTWEMCGMVEIEAETLETAMDIARDRNDVLPLPTDSSYVDGSWALSSDDMQYVELFQDQQN